MSVSSERPDSPAACGLPRELAAGLQASGLDVVGVLAVARHDELVPPGFRSALALPTARSALVLGSSARAFESAFRAAPEARLEHDPVDRFTRRAVEQALRPLGRSRPFYYWERLLPDGRAHERGAFADLVGLARAAGLGSPGRLRLLLHPVFGPWLALRAHVLCELELSETRTLADWDPCRGCPAPCASGCLGQAFDSGASGLLDPARCLATRERVAACESRCASRRACVIGPEHACSAALEAHFMRASLAAARLAASRSAG